MTLPSVINNFRKVETVTRLKKAYSTLSQAFVMAQRDYGEVSEWNFAGYISADASSDDSAEIRKKAAEDFTKTYLLPYLNEVEDCGLGKCDYNKYDAGGYIYGYSNSTYRFIMNDSVIVSVTLDTSEAGRFNCVMLSIDINGKKGPNTNGKDLFYISFSTDTKFLNMYGVGHTRETLLDGHRESCSSTERNFGGRYCGALIQKDGWQIKDDYPWF